MFRPGFIYKDKIGHIKGWFDHKKEMWFVTEFLVYPQHRKQGKGKELAKHLPEGDCYLYATPLLTHRGPHIPEDKLLDFYSSLGFVMQPKSHPFDVHYMVRKCSKN